MTAPQTPAAPAAQPPLRPTQFAPKVEPPALPDVCPLCPVSTFRRREAPVFRDPVVAGVGAGWVCPACGRGVSANVAPDNLSQYLQPHLTDIVDYTMAEYGPLEAETASAALDYAYALERAFVAAHKARPGGLSIETGHFEGTGARILLRLIDALYGPGGALAPSPLRGAGSAAALEALPWLVSIDPYGCKPYHEARVLADGEERLAIYEGGIYGAAAYARARERLAPWSNHALYPVESYVALPLLAQLWPWAHGRGDTASRQITFALLDAEHVVGAVMIEASLIMALDPRAVLVVDNCCNDPLIIPALSERWKVEVIHESDAVTRSGNHVPNIAVKVTAPKPALAPEAP